MKKQYLNIAEKASKHERQKNWITARKLWSEALTFCYPGSKNRAWAMARLEFCSHQERLKTSF
ncbi:ANR family transcriptional regulator [Vibrio jasicida]|uniref:ANR family transcriptional regulator n=1 Tax=Vibrio jasicida TaxID=766224 RepID=UPI000AF2CDDE|nr:ANR family transcriptional regulator [Vibrio jasicida]